MVLRPYRDAHPRLGARVFLAETAAVIGDVVLGDDVSVWYSSVVRGDCCTIRVGARTNIQDNATLHVTNGVGPLLLEEEVTVGHNAVLHACTVRRAALVGMNATVLDGAEIGPKAFLAAGAVVTPGTKVPGGTLWAGSPAKLKRALRPDELANMDTFWRNYLEYKAAYLADDAALVALRSGSAGGP